MELSDAVDLLINRSLLLSEIVDPHVLGFCCRKSYAEGLLFTLDVVVVVVVVVVTVDVETCDEEDRLPTKLFRNCSILCHRFDCDGALLSIDVFILMLLLFSGTFSSLAELILNKEDAIIVLISARLLCSFR